MKMSIDRVFTALDDEVRIIRGRGTMAHSGCLGATQSEKNLLVPGMKKQTFKAVSTHSISFGFVLPLMLINGFSTTPIKSSGRCVSE